MDVAEFFAGHELSLSIFGALRRAVESIGPADISVGRSEIAFRRTRNFAFAWMPEQYLGRGAPLALTIGLRRRDDSTRWKSVVEPAPDRYTHHLELWAPGDVDEEVIGWLREAWRLAA